MTGWQLILIKVLAIAFSILLDLYLVMFIYLIFNAASEDPASNSPNPEINDNDAEASSSSSLVPETRRSSLGVSPVNIPHDQMRMIENINALISEVGFGLLRIRWVVYTPPLFCLLFGEFLLSSILLSILYKSETVIKQAHVNLSTFCCVAGIRERRIDKILDIGII